MKRAAVILLLLAASFAAHADEALRNAQRTLKEQGFYYGETDGLPGPETSAAIRRFQIRNGLAVTGTLTQDTIDSLGKRSGETPTNPARTLGESRAPSAPAESDQELLDRRPATPGTVAPPVALTPPNSDPYVELFARTPYENAPVQAQRDALKRAQWKLALGGFYREEVDGIPGEETSRAIVTYQARRGLDRTGRLDMPTLTDLGLLQERRVLKPAPIPGEPVPGRRVYRGIWVR